MYSDIFFKIVIGIYSTNTHSHKMSEYFYRFSSMSEPFNMFVKMEGFSDLLKRFLNVKNGFLEVYLEIFLKEVFKSPEDNITGFL